MALVLLCYEGLFTLSVDTDSGPCLSKHQQACQPDPGRIRESHPGGESSQEEAGDLSELQLQLIKRLPRVVSQKGAQHAAADRPVPSVPLSEKSEHRADIRLLLLRWHRVCLHRVSRWRTLCLFSHQNKNKNPTQSQVGYWLKLLTRLFVWMLKLDILLNFSCFAGLICLPPLQFVAARDLKTLVAAS